MVEASGDVVMVVVPFPAQGHLNQLLHFCRLVLLTTHDVPVHFVGSVTHNRQVKSRLHGWNQRCFPNLLFHDFPIKPFPTPPPDPHPANKFPSHLQPAFDSSLLHLRPHLSHLLRSLSATSRRVVVVHDSLMSFVAHEATSLRNCQTYAFHSVSAFANLFFQWESRGKLAEGWRKMFPDLPVLTSHGCFTEEFKDFIYRQHSLTAADHGRIINTCDPIEAEYIDLFAREPILRNKPLFPIGPLNPVVTEQQEALDVGPHNHKGRHECLRWLDKQPPSSVLYVSFGTTSTMCCQQINELASGIDRSQQRFVWVLRDADRGDIFTEGNNKVDVDMRWNVCDQQKKLSMLCSLVAKGRGVIVREWAPQLEILGHSSTGGFMSHCGWNSCMESFSHGVPMVVWPMHSDQPRNALMTTEVLRVGVGVRDWSRRHEVVQAAKVEGAIRRLMDSGEGKEMRARAKDLGRAIRRSQSKGGSSQKALESFVSHITRP